MTNKVFYKKRLVPTELGLEVITDTFVSIHETSCFHFCVSEYEAKMLSVLSRPGETDVQTAKRLRSLKRIHKAASRFAFDTEEKALEHLRFLKRKQLSHMKRDTKFIESFLKTDQFEEVGKYRELGTVVPNSKALVHDHYCFD